MASKTETQILKLTCNQVTAEIKTALAVGDQTTAWRLYSVWGMHADYDTRAHTVRKNKLYKAGFRWGNQTSVLYVGK